MFKPRDKVLVKSDYLERRDENPKPGEWHYKHHPEGWIEGTIVAKAKGPYYSIRIEIEGVRYFTSVMHEKYICKNSSVMRSLYV